MKNSPILFMLTLLLTFFACSQGKQEIEQEQVEIQTYSYEAKGDSTFYGLVCSGCTDSVLVFLPDKGGDPIYLNILNANKSHHIFGYLEVGDKIAVLLNPQDSTEVLVAIDIDQLRGTWVYQEMPSFKWDGNSEEIDSIRKTVSEEALQRMDSILQTMMVPREYGYTFKRDFTMMPVGGPPRTTSFNDNTPVEYPPLKRYHEWHLHNGKIIFSSGGIKMNDKNANAEARKLVNDTAEFVILLRDTMAIRFGDTVRGFRLKPDSINNPSFSSSPQPTAHI